MTELHLQCCSTCGRGIFYSESRDPLRTKAYCSKWCAVNSSGRLDDNEARNDLWYWLHQTGRSARYIAELDGVSPAMVYKVIRARNRAAGLSED